MSAMHPFVPIQFLATQHKDSLPDDVFGDGKKQVYQCSTCRLRELCLPGDMAEREPRAIDKIVRARRTVKRGERLYSSNESFTSVYAVRRGFFKTSVLTEDGRDQVTGFFMAGDILGLDGIGTDQHTLTVTAIEDSEVCIMPFAHLQSVAEHTPGLLHQLHKLMSRAMVRDQAVMLLLGSMRAEERIAVFLLNLSQRFVVRGFAEREFHLRMTREEIGSYLGLKLETVSRVFSRLQKLELIDIKNKHVRILDVEGLKKVTVSAL